MMKRDIVCIIPSRYESSRFPGKPLADLCGKPMIQHVYERVAKAQAVPYVAVATDDQRIYDAVKKFGGNAVMTAATHRSGTDRISEAVKSLNLSADAIVVNIQGDQPIFEPVQVDEVIQPLIDDPTVVMSTLIYKIILDEEITHPHAVKVVFDLKIMLFIFHGRPFLTCATKSSKPIITSITAFTLIAGIFSTPSPNYPKENSKNSKPWNNCAHWNTATRLKSSSRLMIRSKWIINRSWKEFAGF